MLHVPGHNDSMWNGEQVMVSDLFFMSETFLSFRHSVQDAQVYLLQEQQCKDILAVVKQKSSMHSGEVPGDELTHLDEEVASSNRMN